MKRSDPSESGILNMHGIRMFAFCLASLTAE
jgi:hypothetical protein